MKSVAAVAAFHFLASRRSRFVASDKAGVQGRYTRSGVHARQSNSQKKAIPRSGSRWMRVRVCMVCSHLIYTYALDGSSFFSTVSVPISGVRQARRLVTDYRQTDRPTDRKWRTDNDFPQKAPRMLLTKNRTHRSKNLLF